MRIPPKALNVIDKPCESGESLANRGTMPSQIATEARRSGPRSRPAQRPPPPTPAAQRRRKCRPRGHSRRGSLEAEIADDAGRDVRLIGGGVDVVDESPACRTAQRLAEADESTKLTGRCTRTRVAWIAGVGHRSGNVHAVEIRDRELARAVAEIPGHLHVASGDVLGHALAGFACDRAEAVPCRSLRRRRADYLRCRWLGIAELAGHPGAHVHVVAPWSFFRRWSSTPACPTTPTG